ncbi:hypothetical protein VNO80_13080 [Phaseolus coccineus]|uniref:Uncharacterized protein n=1 Tax=Phaseolus coccineus TaxID=3886 RepID=A0AAN9RFC0_PHACN
MGRLRKPSATLFNGLNRVVSRRSMFLSRSPNLENFEVKNFNTNAAKNFNRFLKLNLVQLELAHEGSNKAEGVVEGKTLSEIESGNVDEVEVEVERGKKGRIQSGDDCDIEDEEAEGELERIIMEDYDNGDVEEVHTKSKDSSWLRDPNEELMDVEVHTKFYLKEILMKMYVVVVVLK